VIDLARTCRRHRSALLDFVDRGEIASSTADALAHLDRCARCTAELETTVLAITAVRRLGAEVARAEPSPDAWPRLRARITRWSRVRWAILSPTAGMAISVALVAILVAPSRLGLSAGDAQSTALVNGWGTHPAAAIASPDASVRSGRAEFMSRVLDSQSLYVRESGLSNSSDQPSQGPQKRSYPDGTRPVRQEVQLNSIRVRSS
jgi:hypothetical protein